MVEDVIFVDGAVDDLLGGFVDDQDFPLRARERSELALSREGGLEGKVEVGSAHIVLGRSPDGVDDGCGRSSATLRARFHGGTGKHTLAMLLDDGGPVHGPAQA